MTFPIGFIEGMFRLPLLRRPELLAKIVPECPSPDELAPGLLLVEAREGYLKWAHLSCPRCGDHIQLPLAGSGKWSVKIDLICRPTINPSIWEKDRCGAHFFIRKGTLLWCG
jgi:hypothetical protein